MADGELVNRPLVKAWIWWALIWLTLFPIVGVLVSIKFHNPEFLDGIPWLTFGRMRPVHVNGVIFGSFSTVFLGMLYYIVPRLCGVRMYREEWGWWLLWLWNALLILSSLSLLMGYNMGLEAAEFEWPLNILRFVILALITIQVLGTVFRRQEQRFYVSLWYTTAALIWTVMNLILGNALLPYADDIAGVNSAAMHGLYIHYIVGLWITPAGLALIYYFLPLSAKNALFSHKLSLLGFWGLAFFYPFVGTHHYLYSPIPHWTQTISIVTSMLLIIPVWTVVVNFFGTMMGRWGAVAGGGADNYAAKFLMLGAVYYLLGCFQGSLEALRRMQELTHFNDFVIAHSHLTVFGTFIVWAVGSAYYVWPRVTGRKLWSDKLASWHLWLTISGFTVMAVGLSGAGFVQGSMLEHGANFVDTVKGMQPWWVVRTLSGVVMDLALLLMLINFYKTAREGEPLEGEVFEAARPADTPIQVVAKGSWIESPSTVLLVAGFGFFFLAVGVQGVTPWLMAETRTSLVDDVVTGKKSRLLVIRRRNSMGVRCIFVRAAGIAIPSMCARSRANRFAGVRCPRRESMPMIAPICSARDGSVRTSPVWGVSMAMTGMPLITGRRRKLYRTRLCRRFPGFSRNRKTARPLSSMKTAKPLSHTFKSWEQASAIGGKGSCPHKLRQDRSLMSVPRRGKTFSRSERPSMSGAVLAVTVKMEMAKVRLRGS